MSKAAYMRILEDVGHLGMHFPGQHMMSTIRDWHISLSISHSTLTRKLQCRITSYCRCTLLGGRNVSCTSYPGVYLVFAFLTSPFGNNLAKTVNINFYPFRPTLQQRLVCHGPKSKQFESQLHLYWKHYGPNPYSVCGKA